MKYHRLLFALLFASTLLAQVYSPPDVSRRVRHLRPGLKRVDVRLRSSEPAVDSVRLAIYTREGTQEGRLKLKQVWSKNGVQGEHVQTFAASDRSARSHVYAGPNVRNRAVILSAE